MDGQGAELYMKEIVRISAVAIDLQGEIFLAVLTEPFGIKTTESKMDGYGGSKVLAH